MDAVANLKGVRLRVANIAAALLNLASAEGGARSTLPLSPPSRAAARVPPPLYQAAGERCPRPRRPEPPSSAAPAPAVSGRS